MFKFPFFFFLRLSTLLCLSFLFETDFFSVVAILFQVILIVKGSKSKRKMTATEVYGRAESQNFSICSLPLKVIFHHRLSSIKGRLPSKVVFHQKLSSIKGCLSSKVVKVIFHQRSSSIKVHLP